NSFNYTAIKISLPVALLFHYLAPLLVIFWGLIFKVFAQPVTLVSVAALGVALAGMIYMARPHLKEGNRKLVFLGMASAFFYSLDLFWEGFCFIYLLFVILPVRQP